MKSATGTRGQGAHRHTTEHRLVPLGQRFARFRDENPRGTRIPDPLRHAALQALQSGATGQELRQACGITRDQLECWQRSRQREPALARDSVTSPQPSARVFSVVNDCAATEEAAPVRAGHTEEIELRLGGWWVKIRSTVDHRKGE